MVTAEQVKELREMTGAGVMDCKKVLVETDGDLTRAAELLRERGISKAAKKADGNIFTRDLNFNIDEFKEGETKIGQPQLKALIHGFTNKDATEAEKKKYADALKSLSSTEFYALDPDKNQEMIWKAAQKYNAK